MNNIRSINYRNIELTSYHDGYSVYSAIQPICKALSLDYHTEKQKIESHQPLIAGSIRLSGYIDDEGEPLIFLPVYLFSGWLVGIRGKDVGEDKVELLLDLQTSIHRMILSPWYGLFCFPPATSATVEYAIRAVVYDTPNNSVRELRVRSKSPASLAINLLCGFERIITDAFDDDIPSL